MFYKKNIEKDLNNELFKKPSSEYRGAPFWSWNTELREDVLLRQIEYLKEMGFGGFHIHSRSGLQTPYMSEKYMGLVKCCTDKAKAENMYSYLYDEYMWPSGTACGKISENPQNRSRYLLFTTKKFDTVSFEEAYTSGNPYLVGSYMLDVSAPGIITSFSGSTAYYAYMMTDDGVDMHRKEVIDQFIAYTYDRFKNCVGEEFGKTVPSVFSDEPQLKKGMLNPSLNGEATAPWTYHFLQIFQKKYGYDITEQIPRLFFDVANEDLPAVRCQFFDLLCETFVSAFVDNCAARCHEDNLLYTGHAWAEPKLSYQTMSTGEVMRFYRSMDIPGMDLLVNRVELTTAKQVSSVAHQNGCDAVMCENYGVTNWDFDFTDHKFQGDWQAALGMTLRVPHLSWVSLKGTAKRDYPASINYQSPWYKKYSYIEDHYARINTVLTRGVPAMDIAVIHPIESFWLNHAPLKIDYEIRENLDEEFERIVSDLLYSQLDFDFISESLLPGQLGKVTNTIRVGKMEYSAVVVPSMYTIRSTTLEALETFKACGGTLLFAGRIPEYVDGLKSQRALLLAEKANKTQTKYELIKALEPFRKIEIVSVSGRRCDNFVYSYRKDGNCDRLFIANAKEPEKNIVTHKPDTSYIDATIRIYKPCNPVLYNTLTGEIEKISYQIVGGITESYYRFYKNTSLLLSLDAPVCNRYTLPSRGDTVLDTIACSESVSYRLAEDNVLPLDMAQYAIDGGDFSSKEEMRKLDINVKEKLGFKYERDGLIRPWEYKKNTGHYVTLKFEFESEIELGNSFLAYEEAEHISFNEKSVPLNVTGFYIDEDIKKIPLGKIKRGVNVLALTMPAYETMFLENVYILGDFGTKLQGGLPVICQKADKLYFSSVTEQGLTFYGGNIEYEKTVITPDGTLEVSVPGFYGAAIGVRIDDLPEQLIALPPYTVQFAGVKAGEHTMKFTLYGNRYNTLAPMHNLKGMKYIDPGSWYPSEDSYTAEYNVKPFGILSAPVIRVLDKIERKIYK